MRASRSRKITQLPLGLHRDVSTYALAAGAAGVSALALAPQANAQIIYTPAHELIRSNGHLSIDFNHDAIPDLAVREIQCSAGRFFAANSLQAEVPGTGGGVERSPSLGMVAPQLYGYFDAGALPSGAAIGPRNRFYTGTVRMANW